MPAGASLISPWVDLLHSFPSIAMPSEFDYVPSHGFHAKPSLSWPPPTPAERRVLGIPENTSLGPDFTVNLDGQPYTITDQINLYAPNTMLPLPMASPVYAATLGGFCPCQVIVGGGELLRDEQLFLAHKMASPAEFPLPEAVRERNSEDPGHVDKFPPTQVELLVFDDGPHAAPTLGHIDIAKHQYRAISQFVAQALARAQNADVEIEAYHDEIAEQEGPPPVPTSPMQYAATADAGSSGEFKFAENKQYIGLGAGDALPPFERNHMRRYRVDRQGRLYPLEPPSLIRALQIPRDQLEPRPEALNHWIHHKVQSDKRFASEKGKGEYQALQSGYSIGGIHHGSLISVSVFEKRLANAKKGHIPVHNGEIPPPTALVGRRVIGEVNTDRISGGLTNSLLGKLFRRLKRGGPAAEGRKDTMEDMTAVSGSARRSSIIVRPGLFDPV